MSHIPASRMPHTHDEQSPQPTKAEPASGATKPVGHAPTNGPGARDEDDRTPLAVAAMVVGGLAVVGGLVAALLPLLTPKDEPKSKKRKRRKHA
ncbi:hypothetical protein [uncultured Sphingomonas sp.]|uniref:hypothetical protein n=1 Tax=uncultured Sphingomonas sp. TaxID=158754 RepID=UPI0035CA8577